MAVDPNLGITEVNLVIQRGATWLSRAWVLTDKTDAVLREAPADPTVTAKIRATRASETVLYTLTGSVVMLTIAGQYGGLPVAAVILDEIPHATTGAFTWATAEWDLMIGYEPVMGGVVTAPQLVSR